MTKAAGTTVARHHFYFYDTGTWTHANGGSTFADSVTVDGGGQILYGGRARRV